MTKTILFISPTGTLDNGAEISIVNLMKFLVKKGYRIKCFPDYKVPSQEDYQAELQKAGIKTYGLSAVKWWWQEKHRVVRQEIIFLRVKSYNKNVKDIRKYCGEHGRPCY